jgi:hypothetical protein
MDSGGASRSDVARAVLATLPDYYVTTECLSPCFLIRRELVANLTPTIEGWVDTRGLFAEYTVRARRLGFRTVISNRAVVRLDSSAADSAEVQPDIKDVEEAAGALGWKVQVFRASTERDFDTAFATLALLRVGALLIFDEVLGHVDHGFARTAEAQLLLESNMTGSRNSPQRSRDAGSTKAIRSSVPGLKIAIYAKDVLHRTRCEQGRGCGLESTLLGDLLINLHEGRDHAPALLL